MKTITLAKMGSRIFAAIIDLLIMFSASLALYFVAIYPNAIDKVTYNYNLSVINETLLDSNLYTLIDNNDIIANDKLYSEYVASSLSNDRGTPEMILDSLNEFTVRNSNIYLVNSLFYYYENIKEIPTEAIKTEYFKVGQETSNIASVVLNDSSKYEITLMNVEESANTASFIVGLYDIEKSNVISTPAYKNASQSNNQMLINALLYLIPVFFGFSLILYMVIPMISKNGQTLGKYIFKLGVLSQDGYTLKKIYYLPRFIILFLIEFCLGIATFGGSFLISYMMFNFTKKRRSLHDYCANSVVIDLKASEWFDSREEELKYLERGRRYGS